MKRPESLQTKKKARNNRFKTLYPNQKNIKTRSKSLQSKEQQIQNLKLQSIENKNKIISNNEEIKKTDQYITNTYKERGKNQDIAYCESKYEMLQFFANNFFKVNVNEQLNDDNDEKDDKETEIDDTFVEDMQKCIKQWGQWLNENSDKK